MNQTLAKFLAETRQLSPLGVRQARVLAQKVASPQLESLLLLLLHWWERGAAGVTPEQLLEPITADSIQRRQAAHEGEWDEEWATLAEHQELRSLFDKMATDPTPWAPLVGVPGDTLPLVVLDQKRGTFHFSRAWSAVRRLESGLRDRLQPLVAMVPAQEEILLGTLRAALAKYSGPQLHFRQLAACALALRTRTLVISGGPGTGKTSVVMQVLRTLMEADPQLSADRIVLCAPTGRAKARMGETVQKQFPEVTAQTIHGLLVQRPDGSFRYHRGNRLPYRVIVVDEASMVDLHMFAALVESIEPTAHLLLLGDMHQLPSVDAGAVLGDLTEAFQRGTAMGSVLPPTDAWLERVFAAIPNDNPAKVPTSLAIQPSLLAAAGALVDHVVVLDHTYRSTVGIQEVCRRINAGDASGTIAALANPTVQQHCSLLETNDSKVALANVDDWWIGSMAPDSVLPLRGIEPDDVSREAELKYAFEAMLKSRVLVISHNGPLGRLALNRRAEELFRAQLDAKRDAKPAKGWFHGQQVLLGQNHHDLGLFNGDLGLVLQTRRGMQVVFQRGSNYVFQPVDLLAGLESSYAMTVHKSQGSEFGMVMMVLPDRDTPLLTRQILYTGLTRAKDKALLLGSADMLQKGIHRRDERPGGVVLN